MGLIQIYLESLIGYMLICIPFYFIGRIVYLRRTRKQVIFFHEVLLVMFVLYVVGLASQTIIPKWDMGINSFSGKFFFHINLSNENSQANLLPLHTIMGYIYGSNGNVDDWGSVSLLNISANILLFSPLGFFVPLIMKKTPRLKRILLIGLLVTCFVEIIQFFIGRSMDIDDVILNTFGVSIGYGIFTICKMSTMKRTTKKVLRS